jgi:tripartite-type tricarboxylate transporter receptor subunit TctC
LAVGLAAELKTTVYVENVAGASGTIGTQQLVRSQPDGYTLLLASSSATRGICRVSSSSRSRRSAPPMCPTRATLRR